MAYTFLAILPYPFPRDPASVIETIAAAARNDGRAIYEFYHSDLRDHRLGSFRFRFTQRYRDDQLEQMRVHAPERLADASVARARGILAEEYVFTLSAGGVLRTTLESQDWDVRTARIAKTELSFQLYHVAKYIVQCLQDEGFVDRHFEYKHWATRVADNPRDRAKEELLRFMEDAATKSYEDSRQVVMTLIRRMAGMVANAWKRALLPWRAMVVEEPTEIAGELHNARFTHNATVGKIDLFLLPLTELEPTFVTRLQEIRATGRTMIGDFSEFGEFCFSRFDSMMQILGVWLAVLSAPAALLISAPRAAYVVWLGAGLASYVVVSLHHPRQIQKTSAVLLHLY